ncbi:MAG TPA: diguanylate cyclase [Solirubrobacteraceae bacterium]|jgi:PleD family two-component response regulator|nr:diguanylate cyclase [Solirubrobacteraceae bacterium]
MAASEHQERADPHQRSEGACLSFGALQERLDEEIDRARRHDTQLACLLVRIDRLEDLPQTGQQSERESGLPAQTISYVGGALRRELRSFDRIGRLSESELLIALPGADGPRAEAVGRRVLDRLRTIKVEAEGTRRPLGFSVGLAAWHGRLSGEDLLDQTRAALRVRNGEEPSAAAAQAAAGPPPAVRRP